MYRGIKENQYRNLFSVCIQCKEELVIGNEYCIIRKRINRSTGEENYSITTQAKLTEIENTDDSLKCTFIHEGKPQILDYINKRCTHHTDAKEFRYSTFIVDGFKHNINEVLNSHLFRFSLYVIIELDGVKVEKPFDITVLADSKNEAIAKLSDIDVSLSYGGELRVSQIT